MLTGGQTLLRLAESSIAIAELFPAKTEDMRPPTKGQRAQRNSEGRGAASLQKH